MSTAEHQEDGTEAASGQRPDPQRPSAIRMRVSRADPWSVMTTSCLVLLGLGACVLVTMVLVWAMLTALDPEAWPSFGWTLVIAAGVVTLEVVLGTALATLGAFLYNMSSQYAGGVHLTLADDAAAGSGPRPELLPDVGRVFRRLQARVGFPPPGWGARYVEFVDHCGDAWRRLKGRATGHDRDGGRGQGPGRGSGHDERARGDRDDPDARVEETTSG
ncbi:MULTISPECIES: DUF3566 domain-containing protein [unclassified Streptomyces]|uniref:DUF3566 domain-containing protein n=1 Tax=unclassified Streptomyces TaxID=2593676 RepID=UPI000C2747C5|nr:DUF3566 domain-containing protein [Streptomyces sp. CB01373]PJM93792.1 hypothetical protein CG719_19925 [Streptomyces sp. CB01373]